MCSELQIDEETLEKYFDPVKALQAEVGVIYVLFNGTRNDELYGTRIASSTKRFNEIVSVAR